jgi:kynurenine formamidase
MVTLHDEVATAFDRLSNSGRWGADDELGTLNHITPAAGYSFAEEWIGLHIHGHDVTHLDALSHVFWNQRMYNDRPAAEVSALSGAASLGVAAAGRETVGRGVLLDLADPAALGPGAEVTVADLEACEAREHVTVGPGDIVFVRTGRDSRARAAGTIDPTAEGNPGFALECADWFAAREIAVLGTTWRGRPAPPGKCASRPGTW